MSVLSPRARLLAASIAAFGVGVLSKYYRGPAWDFVNGHVLDFFGTLAVMFAASAAFAGAPRWKVIGGPLAIVVTLEVLQVCHERHLEQLRETWLGAHVLGATGTSLDWGDLVAYGLAAAVACLFVRSRPSASRRPR